jgi:hypothetical protein
MINRILFSSILLSTSLLNAEPSVSNAELSKKLDLILGKVGGLEERVGKLESDNTEVKNKVKAVAKTAKEAKTASKSWNVPKDEKEKQSFFNKLKNEIYSQEAKDSGPWAKKESWTDVRNNLTRFQIRKKLGDPHEVKQSLQPRIDQVYLYSGDLNSDGKKEHGIVNFFRDRVVSYQSPF